MADDTPPAFIISQRAGNHRRDVSRELGDQFEALADTWSGRMAILDLLDELDRITDGT